MQAKPSAYPHFPGRLVRRLDGVWDFADLGDDAAGPEAIDPGTLRFTDRIDVPSAYDAYPKWAGRRGLFAYRTRFPVTPGRSGLLRLHGAGMWLRVFYSDDAGATWQRAGDASLPYSGISLEFPPCPAAERSLIVLSDNRFDFDRVPLQEQYFDFYAYGGLFRSVDYHETGPFRIERAAVRVMDLAEGRLQVTLRCKGAGTGARNGSLRIDGEKVGDFTLPAGSEAHALEITVPGLEAWTPDNPALHLLEVAIDDERIVERFGMRTIECAEGALRLNGRPLFLRGVCRHEAHPAYGPALPLAQIVQDIQLMRDCGFNFVRGAHYPQDPRFLDLCDEYGLLVFEESLGWQQNERHFTSEPYRKACEAQTRLMVRNSINHPSVILWGFLNEGGSHLPESDALYQRLANAIREEDPSRPVTYACNHPRDDRNLALVDLVCVNMYPGWYGDPDGEPRPLEGIVPALRDLAERMAGHPDTRGKPLVISEIGAGAIYAWRDPLRGHWSEDYQSDLLGIVCRELLGNPAFSGVALWQFCDGRTYANARALGRPRSFNNKGLFDEYRRPKAAAATVRQHFKAERPDGASPADSNRTGAE